MWTDVLQALVTALREEADQLDQWAAEAQTGGWSTQHVRPMQDRAMRLRALISDFSR